MSEQEKQDAMKIYVIESGQDHFTSVIKAFKDKEQAEVFKAKYDSLLERLQAHADYMIEGWCKEGKYYDSKFQYIDEYYNCSIEEIELI